MSAVTLANSLCGNDSKHYFPLYIFGLPTCDYAVHISSSLSNPERLLEYSRKLDLRAMLDSASKVIRYG